MKFEYYKNSYYPSRRFVWGHLWVEWRPGDHYLREWGKRIMHFHRSAYGRHFEIWLIRGTLRMYWI